MGREYRSHAKLVAPPRRTFKGRFDFFNSVPEGVLAENYCAAGRFGSLVADLSDAIAADGTFSSRLTETSLSPSPGFDGAVAIGTDGAAVAAVAAANASACP